jgi:aminoglycoside phosphotransferase (APT) family kinase protein
VVVVRGIDEPKVTAWLDANIAGVHGPYQFDLIAGGRSNVTFRVTDAVGQAFVLRRPPLSHVLASAHDMAREHRLITSVGQTSVPVPRTLGLCTDVEVNGAPFYVMSYVEGVVLDDPAKAAAMTVEQRRAASFDLIDVLADLHAVDVDAVGLGDLARKDGYIERQLKRWTTQWENSKTRELPVIEELASILRRRIPAQQGVSIAHGDYRFGNCLTDVAAAKIVAVLDWELCTLGDPLADVGYLGIYWRDPGTSSVATAADPSGIDGFPYYHELVERYAARTGRDVSDVEYYRAFSAYRLAVIGEGVYARYLHGAMADQAPDLESMKHSVEWRAASGLEMAKRVTA